MHAGDKLRRWRHEAIFHAHPEHALISISLVTDAGGVFCRRAQWLFAQHMHATLEHRLEHVVVGKIGRRDHHRIDEARSQKLIPRLEGRNRGTLGPQHALAQSQHVFGRVSQSSDFNFGHQLQIIDVLIAHHPCANDTHPQFAAHDLSPKLC